MEAVFFQFHVRSVHAVSRVVPRPIRRLTEYLILSTSLALLVCTVSLHIEHVHRRDGGCLKSLITEYADGPHDFEVLEISITPPPTNEVEAVATLWHQFWTPVEAKNATQTSREEQPSYVFLPTDRSNRKARGLLSSWWQSSKQPPSSLSPTSGSSGEMPLVEPTSPLGCALLGLPHPQQVRTFSFSGDKGWLLLSEAALVRAGVQVRRVQVAANHSCFGAHPLQRALLHLGFVGYEIPVINWLAALSRARGFVRLDSAPVGDNVDGDGASSSDLRHEAPIVDLHQAADFMAAHDSQPSADHTKLLGFKVGVVLSSLFLFFCATSLVAFTLRETLSSQLKFTFLLHHHVRHHMSYRRLTAAHLLDSLIHLPIMAGTLFFLKEFYGDIRSAFFVLALVWLAEVFSAVAVRTTASIRFYPRFFFLYFNLFNVYFFSFPFGFSSLALVVAYGLVAHIGLHFWDRFEVPALQGNAITALHPRSSTVSRSGASVSLRTRRSTSAPSEASAASHGRQRLPSYPPPADGTPSSPHDEAPRPASMNENSSPSLDLRTSSGTSRGEAIPTPRPEELSLPHALDLEVDGA